MAAAVRPRQPPAPYRTHRTGARAERAHQRSCTISAVVTCRLCRSRATFRVSGVLTCSRSRLRIHHMKLTIQGTARLSKRVLSRLRHRMTAGRGPARSNTAASPNGTAPSQGDHEPGNDARFRAFVEEKFDRDAYLFNNPDVKAAGVDPVEHWLKWGIDEGRSMAPRTDVVIGDMDHIEGASWQYFRWKGRPVAVRVRRPIGRILDQIAEQAEFDLGIVAAGAKAISNLREFDATDLLARDGVHVSRIFESLSVVPRTVVATPFLCTGGAEKYVADLVQTLGDSVAEPILVVVTEATEKESAGWEALNILAPLKRHEVLFWRDACGPGHASAAVFARFLNALRPNTIIINNSRVGLDAVAQFGRGLSQYAKIFCTFFSLGVNGIGAPYGARFPRRTLSYAAALTDNARMADTLERMWGGIRGPGVVELPAKAMLIDETTFAARLARRAPRWANPDRHRRWLWVSRVEPFKGTEILAALAQLRRSDEFDVYGPVHGSIAQLGLSAPNIHHKGVLENVPAADFVDYDGFIFTSLFEGMPNIVLEMSQHALPMILADVGGLRGTFDDSAVKFVGHQHHAVETAAAFSTAMDAVCGSTGAEVERMIGAAYQQVVARHSPAAYSQNVKTIFGLESD
ncbi:glycosyltransferase [Burkholderia aenigmatica]|uniref:glycosyltransferase n=1 Tax=Burkholderia aenigmatica TaxID=2015348 RepID=UPI003B4343AA